MEQTRQKAIQRIGELNKIKFTQPTARELHAPKGTLRLVRRKEMKRYEQAVKAQKVKLTKDVSEIDKYLQSVSAYDDYMASLPTQPIQSTNGGATTYTMGVAINGTTLTGGVVSPPVVLAKPNVFVGMRPVFKETKLPRYRRRGRR